MTTRQRIKIKLLVAARKAAPQPSDFERFRRSSIGSMDGFDPEYQAELDRLESQRSGITRLLREVWREYQTERQEAALLAAWNTGRPAGPAREEAK